MTDRALRYRSTSKACRPSGRGLRSVPFAEVTSPSWSAISTDMKKTFTRKTLIWTCRSCNTKVAHVMKHLGMGRRTKQCNPCGQGARTLSQWMAAVMSMKGESDQMPVDQAVQMIHATPPEDRSHHAREIWRLRREHGMVGRGSQGSFG